ncbi:MAG TPA: protein kinase [Gemmatimonadales bacterium]
MATTLTCSTCGESIRLTDRFCSRCGADLDAGADARFDATHPDDDPESPWAEVVQQLRRATHGEFEIGRELGRGGMAAVFLAHDIALDRKVAIKVMSPGLLMGEGMIERFKREAITIAHLNHPNIVSCFSVRQAEGLHFFVMRYIQGRSLDQVIRDAGRLPVPIVRSVLSQVSSALTYAHRSRVVHRDIKPANILIDIDGNAVVTDFGIAKVARLPGHTHTGALVGTPAYMSPEQCAGTEVTGATDQYSLGAVAYEMLTGQAPFSGSSLTVMQAQVETPPPPISDQAADCPPDLEAAVLRMLAKDPAQRFPDMAEAKTALGATPLTEGDPLLLELCRLAATTGDGAAEGSSPAVTPITPQRSAARSALRGSARSITILPPPAELAVGEGFALVALVRGERAAPLPGRAVHWSTDSPQVLHLDQVRKTATAVAPGTAMLLASCDGVEAQVRVLVPADALEGEPHPGHRAAAVQISSPPRSIRAGDSFVLTALPLDPGGQPLNDAPVLWSSSDVQVAVVTAGGWVAALGRGQAVLTATCGLASGSVTVYVEQAKAAATPHRPPERATPAAAPVVAAAAPDADELHRSSWRRRGARTRRRLVNVAALALLAGGSVYIFGGMRDFWGQRQPRETRSDTIPAMNIAVEAAVRPESIPPINRGVQTTSTKQRPTRAVARRPAPTPGDPPTDSVRLGATAEVAKGKAKDPPSSAVTSPAVEPRHVVIDTAQPPRAPATAEREVAGYVPMAPGTSEEPRPAPQRPVATRATRPAPAAAVSDAADEPPLDRRERESAVRDGVEECYRAVRSKDLDRLARLYAPKSAADEDKLRRLTRILRTEPWQAVVGRRVDGVRELGARTAAAEFSFRLTWRDSYGGRLSSQPIFRAEFARDQDEWALSSCRIVGSPKL